MASKATKKLGKARMPAGRRSPAKRKAANLKAARPTLAGRTSNLAPRALTINSDELNWIFNHFRTNPRDMLRAPMVSAFLAVNRLKRVGHDNIQMLADFDKAVIDNAAVYNREELIQNSALFRPALLIQALVSINYVFRNAHELRVLSIGPRSETELFLLYGAEFHPDNVRGLDLISYSELVDLGDMHDMPYPDSSFDVIILGWVLGYSHDPQKVANEVMRVAKPGAYVAIGCERAPPKERKMPRKSGIVLDGTYFENTQEYLDLFKDRVYDVPVRHEVHRKMQDQTCHVIAVIELK